MSTVLIILGLLILIFGGGFIANNPQFRNFQGLAKNVRYIGAAIALLGILLSCIIQIDNGFWGLPNCLVKFRKKHFHRVLISSTHFMM